jgi:hypothetical protein
MTARSSASTARYWCTSRFVSRTRTGLAAKSRSRLASTWGPQPPRTSQHCGFGARCKKPSASSSAARYSPAGSCRYNQAVFKLEDLLECSLPVHPPPINEDELLGLEKALTALVDRSTVITVEGTIETSVASAEAALQAQLIRSHPPLMFTLCVTVFGTEIDLGRAVGQMPDVHVIEMPEVTGADRMVTLCVLIAGGRQDIMCRMLDPGEQAPPGAIPI